jgi:hypothetical protein
MKLEKHEFFFFKSTKMNPNKYSTPGLISQIHIALNLRSELNQEVQFNVEG